MLRYAIGLSALILATPVSAADVDEAQIRDLVKGKISGWLDNPTVMTAVNAQNAKHAGLSDGDVQALDQTWRAETGASDQPMIQGVLANELSQYLSQVKTDGQGLYTEIFVMDNLGLNVGQSDITSDYWQGDEAKFQKTYPMGADALHIGEVEFDESTQTFQVQVSLPVVEAGQPIGAITVGLDAEALQ